MRTLVAALTSALVAGTTPALAQTSPPGDLGVGIVVGSPTGLTAKMKMTPANSVDGAVGIGFGEDLHLHGDWIYEGGDLLKESGATLGFYFGLGARFEYDDDDDRGRCRGNDNDPDCDDDDVDLGPRVPVGLDLQFGTVPNLELFAEIALGFEVIDDPNITLDGGIGARWYF